MVYFSITLSPRALFCLFHRTNSIKHTAKKKKEKISFPANLEEVEELSAHNYTSIQTYVSQSQMPSMCEMGVTPLEVSLFVECVSQHFSYRPHRSQGLRYRLSLIS